MVLPDYAAGLTGFEAHWANATGRPENSQAFGRTELPIVCPPRPTNADAYPENDDRELSYAKLPCTQENPYAPKCEGKTCPFVSITRTGDSYFISRAGAADQTYNVHEYAAIYFPRGGRIRVMLMDIELHHDKLEAMWRADQLDLAILQINDEFSMNSPGGFDSYLKWTSDYATNLQGWTLMFTPDWPTISLTSAEVPLGTTGVQVGSSCLSADNSPRLCFSIVSTIHGTTALNTRLVITFSPRTCGRRNY